MAGSAPTDLGPDVSGTGFDERINVAARANGVPPALLAGLIKQESHFDPALVSPVGARGLTQLMPGTAKDLGVTDPDDTNQQKRCRSKISWQQMRHFDGNVDLALRRRRRRRP